ncbi:ABC-type nitrate/sulfonate/bicarbonate transport system periplasmic component-like protein [Oscillatoria nigro-viridis PCC 7112]|uniref:ABC-type nitrate/sulfonate/bicarbonate transport system periplasmic component-like protein n=1 Tax=Phormidium nigroviride PCC 7112 TaxID=179408 RepID=K9VPD6_9CYAN|nr:ABC transporter substrate-binding protein [Oscillatoria nigro-viridis]AFZ09362.1 ABC-type nitrate/sulfonate/bicarbonate transport system periplasmic component-like protein [Oscillatoria nigro-viridis PCC 7112]
MSKLLNYICIFIITCWLLFACQSSQPLKVKRPSLKVSCVPFVGYTPLIVAQEKGFFKAQGVDVELSYIKHSQLLFADFSAGKYDAIALTLGDFVILSATYPDIQAVMVVDESTGADVVVAQSDIKTIPNLKGKNLGATLGDFSEVFVTEMLKTSKLTSDDVRLVKVETFEVPNRLQNNTIQAGHTWEPYLSEALKLGAHILFTSKQTPGLILDLIAFRGEVIRDRPEDIRAFVRGGLQGLSYWEANIPEGKEIVSKALNIPINTISFEGIDLTDFADNQFFFQSNSPNYIYKTAKKYADFFIRAGNVTRLPNLETLFNSSFLTPPPSLKP